MRIILYILCSIFLLSCGVSKKASKGYQKNLDSKSNYLIEITGSDTIIYKLVDIKSMLKEGSTEIHLANGDVIFGQYKANKKNGTWEYYNKNKELYKKEYYTEDYLSRVEFYKKGKIEKQVITDPTF